MITIEDAYMYNKSHPLQLLKGFFSDGVNILNGTVNSSVLARIGLV